MTVHDFPMPRTVDCREGPTRGSLQVLEAIRDAQVDLHYPQHVDIKIDEDFRGAKRVWINVNGICVLRICGARVFSIEGVPTK